MDGLIKKLNVALSKHTIKILIYKLLSDENNKRNQTSKNYYITDKNNNVRVTINIYTNRVITVDKS